MAIIADCAFFNVLVSDIVNVLFLFIYQLANVSYVIV